VSTGSIRSPLARNLSACCLNCGGTNHFTKECKKLKIEIYAYHNIFSYFKNRLMQPKQWAQYSGEIKLPITADQFKKYYPSATAYDLEDQIKLIEIVTNLGDDGGKLYVWLNMIGENINSGVDFVLKGLLSEILRKEGWAISWYKMGIYFKNAIAAKKLSVINIKNKKISAACRNLMLYWRALDDSDRKQQCIEQIKLINPRKDIVALMVDIGKFYFKKRTRVISTMKKDNTVIWQNLVGKKYRNEDAAVWFKEAIKTDKSPNISAMNCLAGVYLEWKDYDNSIVWYSRSADLGDLQAMYCLGLVYFEKGDYKNSIGWFIKSVKLDNCHSAGYLGYIYANIENNIVEAIHWDKIAIKRGDGVAAYNLARIYHNHNVFLACKNYIIAWELVNDQNHKEQLINCIKKYVDISPKLLAKIYKIKGEEKFIAAMVKGGESGDIVKAAQKINPSVAKIKQIITQLSEISRELAIKKEKIDSFSKDMEINCRSQLDRIQQILDLVFEKVKNIMQN